MVDPAFRARYLASKKVKHVRQALGRAKSLPLCHQATREKFAALREKHKAQIEAVRHLPSLNAAAEALGIAPRTLRERMKAIWGSSRW